MIWFLFIAMTLLALAIVLLPMFHNIDAEEGYSSDASAHHHEMEVYKDQLKEVERDLKQSMLTEVEAEAAKLEISRRMLASADIYEKSQKKSDHTHSGENSKDDISQTLTSQAKTSKNKVSKVREKTGKKSTNKAHNSSKSGQSSKVETVKNDLLNHKWVTGFMGRWAALENSFQAIIMASVVGVSAVVIGLYGNYGSPSLGDEPYAKRFAKKTAKPLVLKMSALEEVLEKSPDDGKAWEKIAPFYMNASKFHKAAFAFRKAIELEGENTKRLSGFAEATIMSNKGKITAPAIAAYTRALKLEPDLVEPRIRLAMALEQKGDKKNALAGYQDILKRSDKNAPWMSYVQKRITFLGGKPPKLSKEELKVNGLIAKVEESLRRNPKEGRGWDVIAPVYLGRGSYKKAVSAFEKAIALLGENAKRLSGLAEATILLRDGTMTGKAKELFKKALVLNPKMIEPQIRLAMGLEQAGNYPKAAKAYQAIIDKSGKKTPWYPIVKQRLEIVTAQKNGVMSKQKQDKGPTQQQIKDAQAMSSSDRNAMINQMVSSLADRLKENGDDLGGWLKLLNAYKILGKKEDAGKTLQKARVQFKGNKQALAQLDVAAKRLGLN